MSVCQAVKTSSNPREPWASWHDVPNELIAMVVDEATDCSLGNLRLVSKRLCTIATPRFASVYFTHLRVFMSLSSLWKLIRICEDSTFGAHVKEISFASQRLLRAPPESVEDHVISSSVKSLIREDDSYQIYIDRYWEQVDLAETGEASDLLIRALRALRPHHNTLSLNLVDKVWSDDASDILGSITFGENWLRQHNIWNRWECWRSGTLTLLLDAAYQSDIPLNTLSINFETWPFTKSGYSTALEDPCEGCINLIENFRQGVLATILGGLRSFNLTLLHVRHDWVKETPASVARILNLATNLEVLRIDIGRASYKDFCNLKPQNYRRETEFLADVVASTVLREIHMSNCIMPEAEMINLLRRNRDKIRVLTLTNCCIGTTGSWSTLLKGLRINNIQLDRLALTDLYHQASFLGAMRSQELSATLMVDGTRTFEEATLNTDLEDFISELQANGF